jgi:hypothetical protein
VLSVSAFDPPPDPPPGANVPPQDPSMRKRGRLTDPSDAPPETGIRRRQAIRHKRIVLVFLWLFVIFFALGLYFILTAEEGEPLLKGSLLVLGP